MAKLTLTDVVNGTNAAAAINANNAAIEAAIENTLSRDLPPGSTDPNHMVENIDMNSHRIINLAPPVNPNDAARYADVGDSAVVLSAHIADSNPHTQYQLRTERGAVGGDATLDGSGLVPKGQLGTGTASSGTFLRGDGTWTAPPAGTAALAEGDYGDIVVTNGGLDVNIDSGVLTSAGRAVIGAADATAQRSALGVGSAGTRNDDYFDLAGSANTAVAAHAAAADPHTGYQRESEKGAASGYASLDANTRVPLAQLGSGTPTNITFLRGDGTWIATGGGGGSVGALDDLTDVTLTAPAVGATLVFNGTTWVNGKLDLTDVDAANYNGTASALYEQGTFSLTTSAGFASTISTTFAYTRVGRLVSLRFGSGTQFSTIAPSAYSVVYGEAATANVMPASLRPVGPGARRAIIFSGITNEDYGIGLEGVLYLRIGTTGTMEILPVISDPDITGDVLSSYSGPVVGSPSYAVEFPTATVGVGIGFSVTYSL